MRIRKFLFDFFHFNKQERNGILVLSVLIVLVYLCRMLLPYFISNEKIEFSQLSAAPDSGSLRSHVQQHTFPETISQKNKLTVTQKLFVFNPNTISYDDALLLGFSPKTAKILMNFRAKGGQFLKREDLKKLYGLDEKMYNALQLYVLIPVKSDTLDKPFKSKNHPIVKAQKQEVIDLNTADSLQIVQLKGVGPAFTKRIMKYRKLLGGFHSLDQIKEVYGMTDSLYNQLSLQVKVNADSIEKIPINLAGINDLKKHPYFNYQTAAALVNYRSKHGRLTQDQLKQIGVFSDEKYRKIIPYLKF